MVAMTITGKFKDPGKLKTAVEAEKFLAHTLVKIEKKLVKGCLSYKLFTNADGSFCEVSIWESKEDIDRIMGNSLIKGIINTFSAFLEAPYEMNIYENVVKFNFEETVKN
ncbi:MAG: putative quinol monooxygenase [Vulcanimicrobiota bacterium]